MRDRQDIEREMYRAREDLETSLAELKHTVAEKIDIKGRARVAVEKGKQMAADAFERGKHTAREYAVRGKDGARDLARRGSDRAYFTYLKAKDRPVLTGTIIAAVAAGLVLVIIGRRRHWW